MRLLLIMFSDQNHFSLTSLTLVDPVFDFQFRIILVGESTVAKTSLLTLITDMYFYYNVTQGGGNHPPLKSTLEMDFVNFVFTGA